MAWEIKSIKTGRITEEEFLAERTRVCMDVVSEDTRRELADLANQGYLEAKDIHEFAEAGFIRPDIATTLREKVNQGKKKKAFSFSNLLPNIRRQSKVDKDMYEAKKDELNRRVKKMLNK